MADTTKPMVMPGGLITVFVRMATLDEARKCLPDLTLEEYGQIREGRAEIVGDSESGCRVEMVPDRGDTRRSR